MPRILGAILLSLCNLILRGQITFNKTFTLVIYKCSLVSESENNNYTIMSCRGNEWSLRAFASMPSTAIFLRAQAEIKNLLCELASNAKIWGARAREHSFKFCEQIEQRQNFASS